MVLDNILASLPLVNKELRREAGAAGKAAIEDLALISEYFTDDVDDFTGKKTPPPGLLKFSLDATTAASKELEAFVSFFPDDVRKAAAETLSQEFQS